MAKTEPPTNLQFATRENTPMFTMAGQKFTGKVIYIFDRNPCYFEAAVYHLGKIVSLQLWDSSRPVTRLDVGEYVVIETEGFLQDSGGTIICKVEKEVARTGQETPRE